MALSNWDTFALSTQQVDDALTTERGTTASIYKNWLYLRSPHLWREGGGYIEDTIGEVHAGEVRLDDLHVFTSRGPQDGIYVVTCTPYTWRPEHAMVGCGVYGYEGDEWVGVLPDSVAFLRDFARQHLPGDHPLFEPKRWGETPRVNQGDAYIAEQLGLERPASAPGEAGAPLLMRALNDPRA